MLILFVLNFFHKFFSMKPPYKESTFSEVDGFGGSDISDISEEALECESDSEEQDTYNSEGAKLIFRSFNHISDS